MNRYSSKEWKNFRQEVIELDGGICCRCGRGPAAGAILQVHHKKYVSGQKEWESKYSDCETLCKGCHSSEHGITRPTSGWICLGEDDLGALEGECNLCGSELRYVFFVQHEKWESMEVGETCCDHLTGSTEASKYLASRKKSHNRENRFINSSGWKNDELGRAYIKRRGLTISIDKIGSEFFLIVNGTAGKKRFSNKTACKKFIFSLLNNGKLDKFTKK